MVAEVEEAETAMEAVVLVDPSAMGMDLRDLNTNRLVIMFFTSEIQAMQMNSKLLQIYYKSY